MPVNRIYVKILLRTESGEWYLRQEDGREMHLMLRTPRPLEAPIVVARVEKTDGWTATTEAGVEYQASTLAALADQVATATA